MFRSLKNLLTKKYDRVEERPFFDFKFKELEDLYRRSLSLGNKGVVQTIAHELSFRTTSSSEELLREVQASIESLNRPTTISLPNDATKLKTSSNSKQSLVDKGNHRSKEKSKFEKFVSFHLLVEGLIRSDKPEVMINSSIWKML